MPRWVGDGIQVVSCVELLLEILTSAGFDKDGGLFFWRMLKFFFPLSFSYSLISKQLYLMEVENKQLLPCLI